MFTGNLVKKIFKEAYIAPIALSLFLVPLFWNPSFIYSFTQGKEILFKAIILLTGVVLMSILVFRKQFVLKNIFSSRLLFLLLIQVCIFSVTNACSSTPIITLYGTYARGLGLIIELFLFVFLIYCALSLTENNIVKLLKVVFSGAIIIASYAIMQKIGFNPFFTNYDINVFAGRVFSFLGNPSYLGQLMLLDIVIGFFLIFTENNGRAKIFYILGTLILAVALVLSGTRTALVGFTITTVLVGLKYYGELWAYIKGRKAVFGISLIIFIVLSCIFITILPQDRYSLSNLALRSFNSRLEIWKGTVGLIKEKPILGYGEETFYVYFPEIVTKQFLTLEEDINMSADRTHNEALEIFFSHGIVAVFVYLLILAYLIKLFFKSSNRIVIVLALVIIANAVQNQLAFSDITINILIAFCFGGLVALSVKSGDIKEIALKTWQKLVLAVIGLLFTFYLGFITVYQPYMSQLAYAESRRYYATDYALSVNNHKKTIAYTPYYSELWYELMFIDPSSMERALSALEGIDGNSGDVLAWKGNFYADTDPQKASEFYVKALERNPYNPNWIRAFADMLYKHGDYRNALYLYNQYLSAVPDFWKWADSIEQRTQKEKQSYETFLKHTPYFWGVVKKVDYILSVLEKGGGE